jgi:AraC-like DNA-binding protein
VLESLVPLARHPLCRTSDVDESRELFSKINTPIEIYAKSRVYAWRSNHVAVGPLGLTANWWGGPAHAIADEVHDIFSLDFPLGDSRGENDHGGETIQFDDETGVLLSPGRPAMARIEAGYGNLEVVIRRDDLEAALTALVGPSNRAPLLFAPLVAFGTGAGRSLYRLAMFIAELTEHDDSILTSPLVAAGLADSVMFGVLQGLQHNHSARLLAASRPAEPRHVRRAAEYLEGNAAQPIRMIDLAAVTGVSVRTLQTGFVRYRGCSPMAFLRDRRLVLARTQLLGKPDSSVTQIAVACGFVHLGRFSAMYRARYGETPSATRRRIL